MEMTSSPTDPPSWFSIYMHRLCAFEIVECMIDLEPIV